MSVSNCGWSWSWWALGVFVRHTMTGDGFLVFACGPFRLEVPYGATRRRIAERKAAAVEGV